MFPHTVTVYNVVKEKDGINYHKQVVSDVFYYVNKIISPDGKGSVYTTAYDVIFSSNALKKWVPKQQFSTQENTYTLREDDVVVLGEHNDITDLLELHKSNVDFFLIKTIHENIYGDIELQNIEVTN